VAENIQTIELALARSLLPHRNESAHKWGVGGVVVIGGAPGYIGAPALCALGAYRSGAGIVSLAISRSAVAPVATIVPEATFIPLPEGESQQVVSRSVELIRERLDRSRAVVVGPGLSRDDQAAALLAALFGLKARGTHHLGFGSITQNGSIAEPAPMLGGETVSVVDADALNWLSGQSDWWQTVRPWSLVLTPHAGEMSRLTGREVSQLLQDPAECAVEAAIQWQQTVVLKAGRAYVTDGTRLIASREAHPSLATAGTGDVLAGSIGAFVAQGLSPVDAATLALYLGGEAATSLQAGFGTLGLVASDLPRAIAKEIARLEEESGGAP
jgi:ADP-dependent NAD(P)H-hydrate dehydratase / NAD(P)H-hydrate epimerase